MSKNGSTPIRSCIALSITMAVWTALASLAAVASIVGITIQDTFLARSITPAQFISVVATFNLAAYIPSTFEKAYGQGKSEDLQYVAILAIPNLILIAGTMAFHWLARRRLGTQPNFAQRTVWFVLSYIGVCIACGIAVLLITGNWENAERWQDRNVGKLMQALGYVTGLIVVNSGVLFAFTPRNRSAIQDFGSLGEKPKSTAICDFCGNADATTTYQDRPVCRKCVGQMSIGGM